MPDRDHLEHPRVTLPKNLSEALKGLGDAEFETLLRELIPEAERRGIGSAPCSRNAINSASPKFPARQSNGSGAPRYSR